MDREYLEPAEVHSPSHDDAGPGLDAKAPRAGLQQDAYMQVIDDPQYDNQLQVSNSTGNYPFIIIVVVVIIYYSVKT